MQQTFFSPMVKSVMFLKSYPFCWGLHGCVICEFNSRNSKSWIGNPQLWNEKFRNLSNKDYKQIYEQWINDGKPEKKMEYQNINGKGIPMIENVHPQQKAIAKLHNGLGIVISFFLQLT